MAGSWLGESGVEPHLNRHLNPRSRDRAGDPTSHISAPQGKLRRKVGRTLGLRKKTPQGLLTGNLPVKIFGPPAGGVNYW